MRRPCEHTVYLPSGLVHTPMGTCDCDRTLDFDREYAERLKYVDAMWDTYHPGVPRPWEKKVNEQL